jgi:XTP/dITP diphosphohydrolase
MMQPLRVVLATGNAGKAREFGRLLGSALSVQPMPGSIDLPPETGETFAANARLKAEAVAAAMGGNRAVLADDSGLQVAALGGRPGVLSARFASEDARDEENVDKLLAELGDRADRDARFVCSLCLVLPERWTKEGKPRLVEVEGQLDGDITSAPRGTDGFGYDPVFQPKGWSLTLAEATAENKDGVSHRGAASRALLKRLTELGLVGSGDAWADRGT